MSEELIEKINHALEYAGNSPFYKKKGIFQSIKSLDDFRKIKPTMKEELRNSNPFEVLSVSMEKIQEYHESFGTTGRPVPVWYSRKDMEVAANQLYNKDLAVRKEDIVLIRFPYAISVPAHIFSKMFIQSGATIIPVSRGSSITPYPRVLEIMKRLKVTILACNPSEAVLLGDVAERLGYDIHKDFNIRALCLAGEMLTPKRRKKIEALWNAEAYDYLGSTETSNISVSCREGNHHCSEDYYLEVVDMKDGITPVETGKGLLLVTQLNNESFPLIRYHTGDIVELYKSDCNCRNMEDILIHHGRMIDMITIGDKSCTMRELQEALFSCERLQEVKYWKLQKIKESLIIYVEGDSDAIDGDIILNIPFPNKIVVVDKQHIQNIDSLLVMTELRKANYYM
jgi:phenylacetate-CoA ligase